MPAGAGLSNDSSASANLEPCPHLQQIRNVPNTSAPWNPFQGAGDFLLAQESVEVVAQYQMS